MRRFETYSKALETLEQAPGQDLDNDFVMSGVIDKFRMQFELGWKLLKKTLAYEGNATASTGSPRDVLKAAFATYDFMDESTWVAMLRDRNTSTHVYDGIAARELTERIVETYLPEMLALKSGLVTKYGLELLTATDEQFDEASGDALH